MAFGTIAEVFTTTAEEPDILPALVASAAAVVIMLFTSIKILRRPSLGAQSSGSSSPTQMEDDSNAGFLRIIFTVLLVAGSIGLIALGIEALTRGAPSAGIWEFLEKCGLAEALALGYYHVMKKR